MTEKQKQNWAAKNCNMLKAASKPNSFYKKAGVWDEENDRIEKQIKEYENLNDDQFKRRFNDRTDKKELIHHLKTSVPGHPGADHYSRSEYCIKNAEKYINQAIFQLDYVEDLLKNPEEDSLELWRSQGAEKAKESLNTALSVLSSLYHTPSSSDYRN